MSIDLYPIIKQIGDDKSGSTYLATNTLIPSRPYCIIKKLTFEHIDPSLQRVVWEKFQRESMILERLGEKSNGMIPKIYAYFIKENGLYLVQEYISGQTLFEHVKSDGLFTESQVRQLLIDILPTLGFLHAKNLVHGYVNPENIRLRENSNKPVLVNFGIAKHVIDTFETERTISISTSGFIPMEQFSGRSVLASDLYSLGLTAIYLLTGKTPEELEVNPSNGNILYQIHVPKLSTQLAGILNVAIAFNPYDRYIDANEMLKALTSNTKVAGYIEYERVVQSLDTSNSEKSKEIIRSKALIELDKIEQEFMVTKFFDERQKLIFDTNELTRDKEKFKELKAALLSNSEANRMPRHSYNLVQEEKIQQSQFWDKADRMAIMIAGGIALGSAIAQLPGAIAGGILAAGYAWYIRLS
jgi:serine/threonine protein kinase